MSVIIYMTSTTTNRDIYHKQSRIKLVLEGKGIKYEEVDLCKDKEKRDYMREKAGIPDLLPPQIFNGDTYCGQTEPGVEDTKAIFKFTVEDMIDNTMAQTNTSKDKQQYTKLSRKSMSNKTPTKNQVILVASEEISNPLMMHWKQERYKNFYS